jgi:hypothetical protein
MHQLYKKLEICKIVGHRSVKLENLTKKQARLKYKHITNLTTQNYVSRSTKKKQQITNKTKSHLHRDP